MSFAYFAKQISLRPEEAMIGVIHHHPVTYLKQIVITVALILVSFFLMFYLVSLGAFGVALFVALLFTGVIYGAREFFIWYANVLVITNQRLIDIDRSGFLSKTVSEVPYEKILDISYTVKGLSQTIFGLGTMRISASGAKLTIKNVANIVQLNQIIADLIREQTGKTIEVKKVKISEPKVKEEIAKDFLNQDELAEYEDYNLQEVLTAYKETFGELKLKKLLIDELEQYEQDNSDEEEATVEDVEQEAVEESETENIEPEAEADEDQEPKLEPEPEAEAEEETEEIPAKKPQFKRKKL